MEKVSFQKIVIILSLVGRHTLHVLAAYLMNEYITNNVKYVCFVHMYMLQVGKSINTILNSFYYLYTVYISF